MKMNLSVRSNVIAGCIAFVIYVVISLLTGAEVGAALVGGALLGLFTFVVSFIITRLIIAARNRSTPD
ncbi:MAG: hypothetical protein ACR2LQ_03675 [Acidimicrobiales bacterium]